MSLLLSSSGAGMRWDGNRTVTGSSGPRPRLGPASGHHIDPDTHGAGQVHRKGSSEEGGAECQEKPQCRVYWRDVGSVSGPRRRHLLGLILFTQRGQLQVLTRLDLSRSVFGCPWTTRNTSGEV